MNDPFPKSRTEAVKMSKFRGIKVRHMMALIALFALLCFGFIVVRNYRHFRKEIVFYQSDADFSDREVVEFQKVFRLQKRSLQLSYKIREDRIRRSAEGASTGDGQEEDAEDSYYGSDESVQAIEANVRSTEEIIIRLQNMKESDIAMIEKCKHAMYRPWSRFAQTHYWRRGHSG
jgi:hypothetical protein